MTGRKTFEKFKPGILVISRIFSLLPKVIFSFSWPLMELVPWKFGILLRYLWAKRLAKSCGDNVLFETGVRVTYWEEIEIGSNVAIYETCYLDGKGGIVIGDNVSIAHQCSLISFDFELSDPDSLLKYSKMQPKQIEIGDDTMIFSGVRVFAGARLAPRTVVGANAVVREGSYKPGLYVGAPAKFKKCLGE